MKTGPIATLVKNDREVLFKHKLHSTTFPVSKLPDWLRFYRNARDRAKSTRARAAYQADVVALEGVEKRIKQMGKV